MRSSFWVALVASLNLLAGCGNSGTPNSSTVQNAPAAQNSAQSAPVAVKGSCQPGAVNASRGTVALLEGPQKGEFASCELASPLKQMIAFQARRIPTAVGIPTLTVMAPAKTGESDCAAGSDTAVNYSADVAQKDQAILVAKGDKLGTCKIETTVYDAHHWSGKLTASLVPAPPRHAAPIQVKAEWDLQN